MLEKYRNLHIERVIEATTDLYMAPGSICKKCHETKGSICCLFCYCPLYETDCGGNYTILKNGLKDCSNCLKPHTPEFVRSFLLKSYKE